jgi:Na+/melibiose symporter-like transporter
MTLRRTVSSPRIAAAADGIEHNARRKSTGLLANRDFRLLWFGETVSEVGNAMAIVAMPLLAVAVLRAGTFMVGLLSSMAYVPWLIMGLPAGALIDRLPSRRVMILSDVAAALLYASIPVAGWLHVLTLWQLFVVALLAGGANIFFTTAYSVNLRTLVAADDLLEGNSKLRGSQYAARITGPGLGGMTAQFLGASVALLMNGLSFLVSAACLLSIRTAEDEGKPKAASPRATDRGSMPKQIAEGFRIVLSDRYLRPLALVPTLANLALSGYTAIVVVFLVRVVGLASSTVGLLLTVSGIGGLVGALLVKRLTRRYGTARTLLCGLLCTTPFGLLIPLTGPGVRLGFFAVGALAPVVGIAMSNIISGSFTQSYCPPAMLGRVTATMWFMTMGTSPLGALLAGALGASIGVRTTLWLLVSLVPMTTLLLLTPAFMSRDLPKGTRDSDTVPEPVSEPA